MEFDEEKEHLIIKTESTPPKASFSINQPDDPNFYSDSESVFFLFLFLLFLFPLFFDTFDFEKMSKQIK